MRESRIFVYPFSLAEFDLLHLEKKKKMGLATLGHEFFHKYYFSNNPEQNMLD